MNIEISVKVAGAENSFKEAQAILLLAQKGIIEKYAARLMSAGSMRQSGEYVAYNGTAITYIDIANVEQTTEIK